MICTQQAAKRKEKSDVNRAAITANAIVAGTSQAQWIPFQSTVLNYTWTLCVKYAQMHIHRCASFTASFTAYLAEKGEVGEVGEVWALRTRFKTV
jgi:hypothetical protein